MGVTGVITARDLILRVDAAEAGATELCEAISDAVAIVAPFDACAVMTMDPDSMLPTGGVVRGFSPDACVPFWDNEILDPDFNKFNVLARSTEPVATLAVAVDGELQRSPRYQKLYADVGVVDELRAVFGSDGSSLGTGVFVRCAPAATYSDSEVAEVRELTAVGAAALRRASGRFVPASGGHAPVVVLATPDGTILTSSEGAGEVLDSLRSAGVDDPGLPTVVRAAVLRARSRRRGSATARAQDRDGSWWRLRIVPMEGADGSVAITIEPAPPTDVVPILLGSYGLTGRQTEIVMSLARGLADKEIAVELGISTYTVRDHVKAIYDKAGVNSRGELVARLFADHVLPNFHHAVSRPGAGAG